MRAILLAKATVATCLRLRAMRLASHILRPGACFVRCRSTVWAPRPKLEPLIEKAGDDFTEEDRPLLAGRIREALSSRDWISFTWLQQGLIYFHNWGRFEGDLKLYVFISRSERASDDLSIGRTKDGYEIRYSLNSTPISSSHPEPIVLGTIPYKFFEVMQSRDQYDFILERKLDKPLRALGWTVKDDDSFLAETDFLYMRWRILE